MYSEQERKVFIYHNGTEQVCADPLRLRDKIFEAQQKHGVDIDEAIKDIQLGRSESASKEDLTLAAKQMVKLADVVNEAFGCTAIYLKAGVPHGLTVEDSFALFESFYAWIDAAQKKTEN